MGSTIDDAAGEAFDKVARLLGLPFPGGPYIDRAAASGSSVAIDFPRGLTSRRDLERHRFDFSFSGLKTAVARWVQAREATGEPVPVADVAASFQEAVCDVLTRKAVDAAVAEGIEDILIGGGVAANSRLRVLAEERAAGTASASASRAPACAPTTAPWSPPSAPRWSPAAAPPPPSTCPPTPRCRSTRCWRLIRPSRTGRSTQPVRQHDPSTRRIHAAGQGRRRAEQGSAGHDRDDQRARPRAGRGAGEGPGVRGVPHRPALPRGRHQRRLPVPARPRGRRRRRGGRRGVTEVAPGDFVVLNWRAVCGDCRACNRGEPWYCFAPSTPPRR